MYKTTAEPIYLAALRIAETFSWHQYWNKDELTKDEFQLLCKSAINEFTTEIYITAQPKQEQILDFRAATNLTFLSLQKIESNRLIIDTTHLKQLELEEVNN